ncbi:MAG: hypothetical protein ABJB12_07910 [Pseudomonadota bacterium]
MKPRNAAKSAICVAVFALGQGALCACATLGPTPAMTGIPAPPLERPGAELQVGLVPGYYLSTTVTEKPKAGALSQVAGVFEPDNLISVPGLLVGARYAGNPSSGGALEPLLGYRTFLGGDKRFSLATLGFLAHASATDNAASFSAWRGGLEAGADMRVTGSSQYAELHTNLGATLTALNADGTYCVGVDGRYGVDCPTDPPQQMRVSGSASGVFPTAHAGLSLDFARHLSTPFHGVRLAVDLAGGTLPTVIAGEQHSAKLFGAGGLSLTLGLGAKTGSGAR